MRAGSRESAAQWPAAAGSIHGSTRSAGPKKVILLQLGAGSRGIAGADALPNSGGDVHDAQIIAVAPCLHGMEMQGTDGFFVSLFCDAAEPESHKFWRCGATRRCGR